MIDSKKSSRSSNQFESPLSLPGADSCGSLGSETAGSERRREEPVARAKSRRRW